MNQQAVRLKAEFNQQVCTYWLLLGAIILSSTIIGIPLLLFWFPIGLVVTRAYLGKMECELTDKALKVKKGMLVRVEKTIPLEKITDMGMVQGPIMRAFGLHTLTVETAGQSGVGALVSLTGIKDAMSFRETVLAQRDAITSGGHSVATTEAALPTDRESTALLVDIKGTLLRIESLLEQQRGT